MAKEKKRQDPAALSEGAVFDMTPMIDVTFLLIIFFMCITELADQSKAKLRLPVAVKAEIDRHIPGRLIINVLDDGKIQVMGQNIAEAELDRMLTIEAATCPRDEDGFPNKAIFIRADRHVEFRYVQNVMAISMTHKLWKLAFATKDDKF